MARRVTSPPVAVVNEALRAHVTSAKFVLTLYPGWDRHTFVAGTGQGDGWGNRTEVIWSNRPLGRQLTLDLTDEVA